VDLISLKARGGQLTEAMILQMVEDIVAGRMDPVQLGALLMAIYQRGLDKDETVHLTRAMMQSGTILQWPAQWKVGDKHSTGGVGDKVSLPLTPALAACGLKVPMISGRGLGHTGGTLDKLESIPGFRVQLPRAELEAALGSVGCVVAGQTADLVPADKIMYAARDVTATVASIPLIVSSILSKKGAESLDALVIDVKFGSGAVTKSAEEARRLATRLVETMSLLGVTTTAVLTCMENPIGRTIGNALEIKESIECLNGGGPADLRELVCELGGELLASAGLAGSVPEGAARVGAALDGGAAARTFVDMLAVQGVDPGVAAALVRSGGTQHLPQAPHTTDLTAPAAGVVTAQDALALAEVCCQLGAGRSRPGDPVSHDVGAELLKVVGERVEKGAVWARLHHREAAVPPPLLARASAALTLCPHTAPFPAPPRVAEKITGAVQGRRAV